MTAAELSREDISLYLLGLTGAEDDLSVFVGGANLCMRAAALSQLTFFNALVKRGVNLDVRTEGDVTPLAIAIKACRIPFVLFLIEYLQNARGCTKKDVLRMLTEQPTLNDHGGICPPIFPVLQYFPSERIISDETRRRMVVFLVEELGMDIWTEAPFTYKDARVICDGKLVITERQTLLALHSAASQGNQPVLDYFLTECGMPVDTCIAGSRFTVLHILATSEMRDEEKLLQVVRWLVGKKGADATCRDHRGETAATIAFNQGKILMHRYLKAEEARQKAKMARERESERRKAADTTAMVTRMQEAEESMAALLLELEAEEEAAEASKKKKKGGKGDGSKKKKHDK